MTAAPVTTEPVTSSRGLRYRFQADDAWIARKVRETGRWEEPVAQAIEAHLMPGWTFCDIGAGVGYFSLIASKMGNRVIAIEAAPDAAECLRQNARDNGLGVELLEYAVLDHEGPAHLSMDPLDIGNPGTRHVVPEASLALTARAGEVEAQGHRLVELLGPNRPELIKIDIEGLEFAVLNDAVEILDAAQVVIFEASAGQYWRYGDKVSDLVGLLVERGFEVRTMEGGPFEPKLAALEAAPASYTNLIARRRPGTISEAIERVTDEQLLPQPWATPPTPVAVATMPTVILCAWRYMSTETAECMMALRERGWGYAIAKGDALIQRVRSKSVSTWFRSAGPDDVFLMIDDDVVFDLEDAERVVKIAREKRGIAVGAYPVKNGGHIAARGFPGQLLKFGPDERPRPYMEPVEILWPATGFMAVHRDVIAALVDSGRFPLCGPSDTDTMWPFFDTFWVTEGDRTIYLSEDYAFGYRARELGFKVWLDPSTILYHLGEYPYNVHNMPASASVTHFEGPAEEAQHDHQAT